MLTLDANDPVPRVENDVSEEREGDVRPRYEPGPGPSPCSTDIHAQTCTSRRRNEYAIKC